MYIAFLISICYCIINVMILVFFPLKSVYIVFRSKRYKLFCPTVSLHLDRLNRIPETIYLGYLLSEDQSDDEDIEKQMRTLYIWSNELLRMFSYCTIDVKMELFRSYCSSLYCCSMWSDYQKAS